MPELAEVKLMSDFINKASKRVGSFSRMYKSDVIKVDTPNVKANRFNLTAVTRGKELKINLNNNFIDANLLVTMGISGNWALTTNCSLPKHAHLIFESNNFSLSLVDPRRFAKWRWAGDNEWSNNRGPCPLTETDEFKDNILKNLSKSAFNKPVYETMMDQKYFNGIGNYLRAWIIGDLDINPFQSIKDIVTDSPENLGRLLQACRDYTEVAYVRGGGELKDWKNPLGSSGTLNIRWYSDSNNCDSIKDKQGRRFWYKKKFKKL